MRIIGPHTASLDVIKRNLVSRNPHPRFINEMVPALDWAANLYGVNRALLIGQAGNETGWGWFPGVVPPEFHNTCGLKTKAGGDDKDPNAHERSPNWFVGAEKHAQHLLGCCWVMPHRPVIDPRFYYRYENPVYPAITEIEQLDTWATKPQYGARILSIVQQLSIGGLGVTEFVSRAQWGSKYGTAGYEMGRVNAVTCHHTPGQDGLGIYATATQQMRNIERSHVEANGWSALGYTWVVSGRYAMEGRGWWRTGAHAPGGNSSSIGIAFLLDARYRSPTDEEWQTAADIVREGIGIGAISPSFNTYGHRDYVATACPGDFIYGDLGALKRALDLPVGPPPPPLTPKKLRRQQMVSAKYVLAGDGNRMLYSDGQIGDAHAMVIPGVLPGGIVYHCPAQAKGAGLVKCFFNGQWIGENWSWEDDKGLQSGTFAIPKDVTDRWGVVGGAGSAFFYLPARVEYAITYIAPAV